MAANNPAGLSCMESSVDQPRAAKFSGRGEYLLASLDWKQAEKLIFPGDPMPVNRLSVKRAHAAAGLPMASSPCRINTSSLHRQGFVPPLDSSTVGSSLTGRHVKHPFGTSFSDVSTQVQIACLLQSSCLPRSSLDCQVHPSTSSNFHELERAMLG